MDVRQSHRAIHALVDALGNPLLPSRTERALAAGGKAPGTSVNALR